MKKPVTVTIKLSRREAELLAVLDARGDVKAVLETLADHAQQGVYRPGSWERMWITHPFGEEWISKLEPGDPYGRRGFGSIFRKPKK